MHPKIIHQVYGIFNDGIQLSDIPSFQRCTSETKEFCIEHGYEYKMWGLKECEELICDKYLHYVDLWNSFRYPIQRCDFIRYLILYEFGGWYVDCDVFPIQDLSFVDSPSSTSALTYKVQMAVSNVSNNTFIQARTTTSLIAMEVAG